MLELLKQKKLYVKLLIFFVGLSIAIVLALSIAFQSIYRNALLDEMFATYVNELQNRSNEIEKLEEEVDYIYLTVISNWEVERFITTDTWNPLDEYEVKQQFSRFRNIHSKLHSVYLYNGTLGYVVTTDAAGVNLVDFPDKEVFDYLTERKQIQVRQLPAEMGEDEQVVSFIYTQFDKEDRLESSIVINVTDLAELGMLGQPSLSSTLLLDDSHRVLLSNTEDLPEEGPLWDSLDQGSGSYVGKDQQGNKYIVSYYTVPSLGWTLVSLHDYTAVMGSIQAQTSVILYLALGILALSGTVTLFLSRNLYLPIANFVRKVSKADLRSKDSRRQKSELDYLMESFSEMMEKVDRTQRSHEQIVADMQKDFYRQALSRIQEGEEVHTLAQRYGIDIERAWFCAFVVKLDQYYAVPADHRSLRKTTARQIVAAQLDGSYQAGVVTMPGGTIAAILFFDGPFHEEALLPVFQKIGETVEKTLGQTVTIGLGRPVEDFGEVRSSYEAALSLTEWRLTLGWGHIFTDTTVPEVKSAQYPDDLEKQLLDALHVGRQKEYDGTVRQLIQRLGQFDPDSAKLYVTQILLVLANAVNQVDKKSQTSVDLSRLAGFLSQLETLEQTTAWFSSYYQAYQTLAKEASLRKNSKKLETTIRQAKAFLEEHAKDPNLSIEMAANHFGYTANYFAKIFKDSTGQYINDYIRECRIGRAKALLTETNLTVSEVAELTGYYNTNYFFYAFKKMTGMTPASYRASIKEKL